MSLKWKANRTAKCGPFKLEVCQSWPKMWWYFRCQLRDYNFPGEPWGERVRTYGHPDIAKRAAERWLKKQAAAMLRDLSPASKRKTD
jgi:hypothetical protein